MSLACGRAAIGLSGIQLIHHTHAEQHVNVQHTHGDHTHTSTGGTDSGGSGTGSGSGTVYFINGVVSADLSADPILEDTVLADYLRESDLPSGALIDDGPDGTNATAVAAILTQTDVNAYKTVGHIPTNALTSLPTGQDEILTSDTEHGFKTVADLGSTLFSPTQSAGRSTYCPKSCATVTIDSNTSTFVGVMGRKMSRPSAVIF